MRRASGAGRSRADEVEMRTWRRGKRNHKNKDEITGRAGKGQRKEEKMMKRGSRGEKAEHHHTAALAR
ncbi:hypothetical protein NHX12_002220 [Muraenolepis orangiensis]|uniref:Uncharacterized protein n=1 Tax=Muraenolepis orangiensis TaxID=630683 RepID=A0A9Q0DWH7_9TELE|nr:hypothetical protein NHX12_002220 [Muraenolepis orangiensis]